MGEEPTKESFAISFATFDKMKQSKFRIGKIK